MKRSRSTTATRLVERGFRLFEVGRSAEAAETFRAAVVLDPEDEDAQVGLGCSLVALGRHPEAAIVFGIAAATAVSNGAWPTLLAADALVACKEPEKARGALAWFAEIERSGPVLEEQRELAAQIALRLGGSK